MRGRPGKVSLLRNQKPAKRVNRLGARLPSHSRAVQRSFGEKRMGRTILYLCLMPVRALASLPVLAAALVPPTVKDSAAKRIQPKTALRRLPRVQSPAGSTGSFVLGSQEPLSADSASAPISLSVSNRVSEGVSERTAARLKNRRHEQFEQTLEHTLAHGAELVQESSRMLAKGSEVLVRSSRVFALRSRSIAHNSRVHSSRAVAHSSRMVAHSAVRLGIRVQRGSHYLGDCWQKSWEEGSVGLGAADRTLRLRGLAVFALSWALAVVGRLHYLQQMDAERWRGLATRQHETSIQVQGARGTVLDAAGRTLAVSVEAASIGVHPREIANAKEFAAKVAPLIGSTAQSVEAGLRTTKPFIWVARSVPAAIGRELRDLDLEGLSVVKEFRRFYPQGDLASPILGHVGRDGEGQAGIELAYESRLSAPSVKIALRRDAKGRLVAKAPQIAGSARTEQIASLLLAKQDGSNSRQEQEILDRTFRQEGGELELTIDTVVQGILEQELDRGMADAKAKRVWGLAMDASTGDVLAAGQSPRFDPNKLDKLSPADLRNFVAQDSFEPGSTFKPLVAAIALERGKVRQDEMLDCENGRFRVGKHIIKDVHPAGVISFSDVLVRSSNVCMSKLGLRLGKQELFGALKAYGFGEPTGVEMHGETKGILKRFDDWREIDVATNSFGQGISVSGLQMVQAYAALANGGLLVKPTMLKGDKPTIVRRILKPETSAALTEILRGVTESEEGTGRNAAIAGVRVSGKTGTAQKAREGGRGYDNSKVLASFIGFVDGTDLGLNRKVVMLIVVDEPGVYPRWGGTVAAPVFRRAMERILSHLMSAGGQSPMRTASAERLLSNQGA